MQIVCTPDAARPPSSDARNGEIYRHSNSYKRVFRPTIRSLGRQGFRFHDLRHTYATLLISQGPILAWLWIASDIRRSR